MRTRSFLKDGIELVLERCYFARYERLYVNGTYIGRKETLKGGLYSFKILEGKTLIPYKVLTSIWMSDIALFRNGSRIMDKEEVPIVMARLYHDFELV